MPLFERDRYQRLPLDVSSAGGGAGAGGGGARRPASSCASATIILFVGLCLVGAWMMASTTTSNVAVSVSSENKGEDDRSADLTRSVVNGGKVDDDAPADTTQTGDAAGAGVTGKKDDGGSVQTTEAAAGNDGRERQQAEGGGGEGDTPHTTENAGKEDEDGPGDMPQTGDAVSLDPSRTNPHSLTHTRILWRKNKNTLSTQRHG